jgi:hypothetical protein
MIDVLAFLPAKRKQSSSGWLSFNAPCCVHNGNTPDRRSRGGIKLSEQGWSYHCFNCSYTASFILGRNIGFKARRLLEWLGVPENDINQINLESMRHRSMEGMLEDRQRVWNQLAPIEFKEADLPNFVDFVTPDSADEWAYLQSRHVPEDYPVMVAATGFARKGVVVPFTYNNRVVGSTIRFLDNRNPRYINDMPRGYVFGMDLQQTGWQHVIVTEGIFDALCIGGLAVMHNEISDEQVRLIRSLGRDVTVVPDQDQAGVSLIDRAVELGWAVSIPDWPDQVKDVNDAVKLWGKLPTLLTILQSRETSKIKIELRKRQLEKKINRPRELLDA